MESIASAYSGSARAASAQAKLRFADDAELVSEIRAGAPGAFDVAYDRHYRAIVALCRSMLGDRDEGEDAAQHTFMAAYNDIISSEKPIAVRAWLYAIARNRCLSVIRGRREHPSANLQDTATEGLALQVERRQDLRNLVVDLQELPEDQRTALVLAGVEALSHKEIATVLGVAPEKVKALVFQGRESLLASRTAREIDCAVIREQLVTLHGGGLRRGHLRRHLAHCAGCREFRDALERERHIAAVLRGPPGTLPSAV